jgi:hypothetical protein
LSLFIAGVGQAFLPVQLVFIHRNRKKHFPFEIFHFSLAAKEADKELGPR